VATGPESRPSQIGVLCQEASYQVDVTTAHGEEQLDRRRGVIGERDSGGLVRHDHDDRRAGAETHAVTAADATLAETASPHSD